jgi:hypothetical protein
MTAGQDRPAVVLLDLRDGAGDVGGLEGAVLVLDDAGTAAEHDDTYQALLGNPQVSGVLCVAVDGTAEGPGDGMVRLRPAPSLGPAERAATIWIGHQHGIRWRPTETVVRGVRPSEPSGLRQLVNALSEPSVFDEVVTKVGALPYSTASAGIALERTSLPESELHRVEDDAIVRFTDPNVARTGMHQMPHDGFRAAARAVVEIGPLHELLVPGGELAAARGAAFESLQAARHQLTRFDNQAALFGRDRPGRLAGPLAERAYLAVHDFHQKVVVQLLRIDGNLRGERVAGEEVGRLGVWPPVPARPREVRDAVRRLAGEWLGRYRSLSRLLAELDAERIGLEPQGTGSAMAQLETLTPPDSPAPRFAVWPPLPAAVTLAALSGMLAAVGVAPALLVPVLGLLWFGAGWLLHARQPTAGGELGFSSALAPGLLFWGLPAAAGGALIATAGTRSAPPWQYLLTALAVVVFAGTALVSWRRAVARWRRALALDDLQAELNATDGVLGEVLRHEWQPANQRALLADDLRHVSIGLTAVQEALAERPALFARRSGQHEPGSVNGWAEDRYPQAERDIYLEVCQVVLADLADLTVAALRPCWAGIDARRPPEPAVYTHEVKRLLGLYRDHVARNGLLVAPAFGSGSGSAERVSLAARLWAGSSIIDTLATGVTDEMTQLCQAGQIGAVSAMAAGASLVRFAPLTVRESLLEPGGTAGGITWTANSEIAGTLRLVPLRQGIFR